MDWYKEFKIMQGCFIHASARIEQLQAENEQMRKDGHNPSWRATHDRCLELIGDKQQLQKAILDFGNNPAGFDWAILEKLDAFEVENETLKNLLRQLQAENEKMKKVIHEQGKCLALIKFNISEH